MATQATYCTERDLKDIFPEVDSFDTKTPIYGWTSLGNNLYRANNVGLVTKLFKDGAELISDFTSQITIANLSSDTGQDVSGSYGFDATTVGVDDASHASIKNGQFYKIAGEIVFQYSESSNNLSLVRGLFGTSSTNLTTSHDVYHSDETLDTDFDWAYDKYTDSIFMYSSSNPNDSLMESGDDWVTLKDRYMKNASEYLDSRLDGTLPRERFKDQDGNYDYIIVRTSALLAAVFLIRSQDPTSEVASALFDEATDAIDKINDGQTKLSWQTTQSDSQGVVRQISDTGNLRIVDTRGDYTASTYDKIGVRVTTAGAIGTAKYSVWISDGDKIGTEIMAATSGTPTATTNADTTDTIDGMYQPLASGIEIRFAGDTGDTATAGDAWEIEVTGKYEAVDNSSPKSIKMTRRGTPRIYRWR